MDRRTDVPPFGQRGKQRVPVLYLRRENHLRRPVQRGEVDFQHGFVDCTEILRSLPTLVPAMIKSENHVESKGRRLPDQRPPDSPGYPRQRPTRFFVRIVPGDIGVAYLRVPIHECRNRNRSGPSPCSARIESHPHVSSNDQRAHRGNRSRSPACVMQNDNMKSSGRSILLQSPPHILSGQPGAGASHAGLEDDLPSPRPNAPRAKGDAPVSAVRPSSRRHSLRSA